MSASSSSLIFLTALACVAQQPADIRVDVRLVNVSFTARDASGRLLTSLTRDDIEVLEDGTPQKVAFFAHADRLPLRLGLLVDASPSQAHFLKDHEQDVQDFLAANLSARDRAFLLCFGNRLRLAADLTSSAPQLILGLRLFEKTSKHLTELGPSEIRTEGTAFYDALFYGIRDRLASAEGGRRALILFSDGEDNSSAHHLLDAIETAQNENVVVYALRYTETRKGRVTARNKYGTRVMARIARDTGGADFDARSADLPATFRAIGEDLRSGYEIGYHSSNPHEPGAFRKITIRPKDPAVRIQAKTGYWSVT